MGKFIVKRCIVSVVVFFGITLLVYVLVSLTPGSPAEIMLGGDLSNISPAVIEATERELGLDKPIIIRYFLWLGQLLRGNMGISYRTGKPVFDAVLSRLGPTLLLTISSTIVAILIAVPLGAISAYKPYSSWDYVSSGLAFVGTSVPNFFVALVLIYLFSVKLGLLPVSGMYDSSSDPTFVSLVRHLICPLAALCLSQLGSILRQTRGSMLEALHGDYVRTCRAQGMSEWRVVVVHGLRNAMLPILTEIGGKIPFIIGGAVVTEQIFSWPGLGSLMVTSINNRDYATIMGITVFIAVIVLLGNILLDILYGVVDPRIRHSR